MFGIDDIIGVGMKILDKVIPDPAAKAEAQAKLVELQQQGRLAELQADTAEAQELTKRQEADMASDSWLSKNVRPLVLIFLVVSTVLMVFIDAGVISFEVKANWIDLLQLVLITVIGAYFGGRSAEKFRK